MAEAEEEYKKLLAGIKRPESNAYGDFCRRNIASWTAELIDAELALARLVDERE